jgi:hypothetical protein
MPLTALHGRYRLTAVLAVPAQVSRGSFRIDRTLAPLRADAAFQSLIADR